MFFDNLINSFLNYFSAEDDRNQNKNQYKSSLENQQYEYKTSLNENQRQYNTSLAFNQSQAQLQQQNWEKNFAQQQYNYENASQIRANDMQKAGLNPLMLVGGAEGSTPVSLGSSVVAPSSVGSPSPGAPSATSRTSIPSQIKFGLLEHYLESKERDKDRENAKKIAEINAQAQRDVADTHKNASDYSADRSNEGVHYGADKSASTAADYLAYEKIKNGQEFGLAWAKYDSDEVQRQFERDMQEKGLERQQARDIMDFVMHDKDLQFKINQLKQAKEIADDDRRMQYITRFGTELLGDITRLVESSPIMFGKLGKEGVKKATEYFKKKWKQKYGWFDDE